jgi:hypothetical protein
MRRAEVPILVCIGASLAGITEDVTRERLPKPIGIWLLFLALTEALERRKAEMSGKLNQKD